MAIRVGAIPFNSFDEKRNIKDKLRIEFNGKVKIHITEGSKGVISYENYTSYESNVAY